MTEGEDGFSLVEAVVALSVLFVVLTVMAHNLVAGLASVSLSRQRQVATELANRAIEQVRDLPFTQVELDNADLAASVGGTDPAISTSGTDYLFRGRVIARGDVTGARAPLAPHTTATPPQPGTRSTYTTRVYATAAPGGDADSKLVTVRVTWDAAGRNGAAAVVEVESLVYRTRGQAQEGPRPGGPYWYATADGGPAVVRIHGTVGGQPADLSVVLLRASAALTAEQRTKVDVSGATSYATLAGTGTSAGLARAVASADDDPRTALADEQVADPDATAGDTLAVSGTSAALSATLPGGTTADAIAAGAAAGQTPPFGGGAIDDDLLGFGLLQGARTGAASASLAVPAGTAVLLNTGSGFAAGPFTVDRDPGADPTTLDDDTVAASSTRGADSVDLLGLPSGVSAGTGWDGALLHLDGYAATASATAGPTTTADTATQSGTLRWFTGAGSGYSSVDLASATADADVTATATSGSCTFTIDGHVTGGGTSAGRVGSPLQGTFTYQVVCGGTTVADLTVDIDLGATVAAARWLANS